MILILIASLVTYASAAHIIANSKVTQSFRSMWMTFFARKPLISEMIKCSQCVGFWIGLLGGSICLTYPIDELSFLFVWVFYPFVVSALAALLTSALKDL